MKKPEITLDELRDMASKYPNDGPVGGMRGIVLQLCDHLGEMQAANDAIASDFGERTVLLRDAVEKLGGKGNLGKRKVIAKFGYKVRICVKNEW